MPDSHLLTPSPSPSSSPLLSAKCHEPTLRNGCNPQLHAEASNSGLTHPIWPHAECMLSSLGLLLQTAWIFQEGNERQEAVYSRFTLVRSLISSALAQVPQEQREEIEGMLSGLETSFEEIEQAANEDARNREKEKFYGQIRALLLKVEQVHPHATLLPIPMAQGSRQWSADLEQAKALLFQILLLVLFTKTLHTCFPLFEKPKTDQQVTSEIPSQPSSSPATASTSATVGVVATSENGSVQNTRKTEGLQSKQPIPSVVLDTAPERLAEEPAFSNAGEPSSSSNPVPIPTKGRRRLFLDRSASAPILRKAAGRDDKGKSVVRNQDNFSSYLNSSISLSNARVSGSSDEDNGISLSDAIISPTESVSHSFADSAYGSTAPKLQIEKPRKKVKAPVAEGNHPFNLNALSVRNPADVEAIRLLTEQNAALLKQLAEQKRMIEAVLEKQDSQAQEIERLNSALQERQKNSVVRTLRPASIEKSNRHQPASIPKSDETSQGSNVPRESTPFLNYSLVNWLRLAANKLLELLKEIQTRVQTLEIWRTSHQDEFEKLQRDVEDLKAGMRALTNQQTHSGVSLDAIDAARAQQLKKIAEMEEATQAALKKAEPVLATLNATLAQLSAKAGEIERAMNAVGSKEDELAEMEEAITNLVSTVESALQSVVAQTKAVTQAKTQLSADTDALIVESTRAADVLNAGQKQRGGVNQLRDEFATAVSALEEGIKRASNIGEATQAQADQLNLLRTALSEEIQESEQVSEAADKLKSELPEKTRDLEKNRDQLFGVLSKTSELVQAMGRRELELASAKEKLLSEHADAINVYNHTTGVVQHLTSQTNTLEDLRGESDQIASLAQLIMNAAEQVELIKQTAGMVQIAENRPSISHPDQIEIGSASVGDMRKILQNREDARKQAQFRADVQQIVNDSLLNYENRDPRHLATRVQALEVNSKTVMDLKERLEKLEKEESLMSKLKEEALKCKQRAEALLRAEDIQKLINELMHYKKFLEKEPDYARSALDAIKKYVKELGVVAIDAHFNKVNLFNECKEKTIELERELSSKLGIEVIRSELGALTSEDEYSVINVEILHSQINHLESAISGYWEQHVLTPDQEAYKSFDYFYDGDTTLVSGGDESAIWDGAEMDGFDRRLAEVERKVKHIQRLSTYVHAE